MARKNIIRILSSCCMVLCTVMIWTYKASATDITVTVKTFTVSGSVGVEGVEITGFPDDVTVTTDSSGTYYATVEYGKSFTIRPVKPGYTFSPASKSFRELDEDQYDQDFTATAITYTISGKIGTMAGVELGGLPGTPTTDSSGNFSVEVEYGFEGEIIPYKEGFKFTPESFTVQPMQRNVVQNFSVEPIRIVISGDVGTSGAVIEGLPGNIVSDADGKFSTTVEYGWTGTIEPKKEGWTFEPASTPFQNLISDQEQIFYAEAEQFLITGTTGMAGVKLEGFPIDVYSGADGLYTVFVDYGFSGTVRPVLEGYEFKPATKIYSKVTSDKENENYEPSVKQYIIKGKTGMPGVTMVGLPGDPVTTGSDGSFSVTVDYGFNGTVIPEKEGYTFEPSEKSYVLVAENYDNETFRPSLKEITINGNCTISGVTLRGIPGKPVLTDADGNYEATVKWGWSGKIIPVKEGFQFDPPSIDFTNITEDQYGQSFAATAQKFTISGRITSNKGKPAEGIAISAGSAGYTTTDENGNYTLEVDYGWEGGVMPDNTKEGYTFQPQTQLFTNKPVKSNVKGLNFTAIIETFKISDVVQFGPGKPISGVTITGNNGATSTVTNAKGEFTIEVPYGWTGEYTLTKKGIDFKPDSMHFDNVTTDYYKNEPVIKEPPVTGPGTTGPDTTGPDTTGPGTTGPGTTGPGTTGPDTTGPGTTGPDTTGPGTTGPGTTGPGTTGPSSVIDSPEYLALLARLDKIENRTDVEPAATTSDGEYLINEEFFAEDLLGVFDTLMASTGILINYDVAVSGVVTGKYENMPLDEVLELILEPTPYYVKRIEGKNGRKHHYLVSEGAVESPLFHKISTTEVYALNYISAWDARNSLNPAFRDYVNAVEDPNERAITVTGPEFIVKRIMSDIMQLDARPSQVLLEARIVVLDKGDLLNLGVEWGWPTMYEGAFRNDNRGAGNAVLDLAGKTAWGIQMGYTPDAQFTNALQQVLNMMQVNDEAKIVANPAIIARDNRVASIKVLNEDYYILYASGLADNIYSRQEMEKIVTGTVLTFTPHISDTNDIELEMAVEVSDTIPKSGENNLPSVRRRTTESTLRLYDGGSVAIAGLSENKALSNVKEVPGLADLPLIGPLFRNNRKDNVTKEVAIFVTASVVPESSRSQVGFLNNLAVAVPPDVTTEFPMSDDMYKFNYELEASRNNSMSMTNGYGSYNPQPAAQPRRTTSAFNDDPFLGFDDSSSSRFNEPRRESRPLSEQDAFRMQLREGMSSSDMYGGSRY